MVVARRTASAIIILALLFSAVAGTLTVHACAAEGPWVSKAPMHEGRSGLGVAVVNGKIYAIGGANPSGTGGFSATNEEYDPATDTWTFKASMPTPRSDFGIAVCQNEIYCIGGYTVGFTATAVNEVYDPATDTWETKAPMPTARENLRANVVNGRIYLIGGIEYSGVSNRTEVYDPVTDTWITKAPIQTAVESYASAVVNNKIYVITSNLNQIYDAESDSWSLGAPPASPLVYPSAGATTGVNTPERIYVFGADADMPFWQLTFRKFTAKSYDPKTDSWTACTSTPTGRFDAGVAVINDRLYVIGGYSFTLEERTDGLPPINPKYTFLAVNEQYTPADDLGPTQPSPSQTSTSSPSPTPSKSPSPSTSPSSTPSKETSAPSAEPTQPKPLPETWPIASGASVAIIGVGLLVYFKKRNHSVTTRIDSDGAVA
jgi:N-acetylneuraminic acid mutarotase